MEEIVLDPLDLCLRSDKDLLFSGGETRGWGLGRKPLRNQDNPPTLSFRIEEIPRLQPEGFEDLLRNGDLMFRSDANCSHVSLRTVHPGMIPTFLL